MNKQQVYCFEVKFKTVGEDRHYRMPFYVMADTRGKAQTLLEKWLENPEQTGLKYECWDSIRPKDNLWVLVADMKGE